MKKLLLIAAIAAIFNSCSKDSPSIGDPNFKPAVSAVPSHFIQKLMIESFTNAFDGNCPKANLILDSLIKFNSDRIYGVQMHINDIMTDTNLIGTSGRNYFDSLFNPTMLYPSGMINRHLNSIADISPANWTTNSFTQLSQIPSCGLALEAENITAGVLTLTVHVGFSDQMFGDYRIHVFVVENQVYSNDSLYDQMNNFSINGITPDTTLSLYNLDDTIHLYKHMNVFRKDVTPSGIEGLPIPPTSMVKGNDYTVYYSINLSGINTANSHLLVFVDKHATTLTGHWIENVQRVNFSESKDWN